MSGNFEPTGAELLRFLPEIVLTLAATFLMVLEPLTDRGAKRALPAIALLGLVVALFSAIMAQAQPGLAFSGMIVVDGFTTFFRVLVIAIGILTILISTNYLRQEGSEGGEYYALLLFSIAGQCIMIAANELIILFIGLEASSIATYIMAGYLRDDKRNNEAALKYFLLGSFATAFLLYGIAWTYGLTGTTNLSRVREVLLSPASPDTFLISIAAGLMFVGFAFKVSAAPFQMWAPDVYQGAPAPVSGFMSAGPKAAAFAVLLRVFLTAFEPVKERWEPLLWWSALATMIIGNFAALRQGNIKRLLAYSSIAHAGYVMVAVTAHSEIGTTAAMFYLAAYALTNLGAFALVTHVARHNERYVEVNDFAGLGQRQPVTAALLTVFLLSLIGVPLTAGFFGKFYIFRAALDSNLVWLTILGLLNSALAAYYYLRIIVVMYMQPPSETEEDDLLPMSAGIQFTAWFTAAAVIVLGVYPSLVLDFAGRSAALLR
ncbi:MAG: NADH-quinone oxidoreductase subunit N [Bryobacterales bacterium]|nr:NADH-quinone oxidoreductase subunit N [Bryobacterales bacterium]